jgi:thiol:disulfide interchange protein
MNKTIILSVLAIVIIILGMLAYLIFQIGKETNSTDNSNTQKQEIEDNLDNQIGQPELTIEPEDNSNNQIQTINYQKYSKEKLAEADSKTVILFFKASWCPSCKALDKNINENLSQIPDDVLILEVAYDKSSGATEEELELGKRNNVNYQHTLMVVDTNGDKVRDVISAFKLSEILADL